ncbi:phage baseplate assembly protein V [Teredinibacter haidensis]|uniref:phage baseplate assembly protein V n=1 Tax=Teredinibacter haidensis TaxID=2731755 RepID=UPI000948A5F2|nr:phage baseplate assembly protein V [Teredinibacter haidensis]
MSELIDTLRAIVRDELSRMRAPEMGIVAAVYPNDTDGNNHQVDVRLRNSGVELMRVPVTVQRYGLSALPRVDDAVVVVFLGGDLNAPMVIGCVYNEEHNPPEAAASEMVYQIPDDGGERHLYVELPSGMSITVNDESIQITAGGTEVQLEQDGDLKIVSAANIDFQAQGDISLEASGKLNLKASQDVNIQGMNVKNQADVQLECKGSILKFGGMAQFSSS